MNIKNKLYNSILFLFCLVLIGCEKDEAPSGYLDYQTKTHLSLPFNNSWYVVWGGRTINDNYHASLTDQRFAIDVVQIENGSTFMGDGTRNEHYYCYGDTLYAPAFGRITEMKNTVAENIPGETNTNELFGNYVIIEHGNDEYSVLAHMITNSIVVNPGNTVSKGDVIGLCGNSGNSTEPHLHYHLQNSPSISSGVGLPAQFQGYYANDSFISRGEPSRGETIRKTK